MDTTVTKYNTPINNVSKREKKKTTPYAKQTAKDGLNIKPQAQKLNQFTKYLYMQVDIV